MRKTLQHICGLLKENFLSGFGDPRDSYSNDMTLVASGNYLPIVTASRKSKLIITNMSSTVALRYSPNDKDAVGAYLRPDWSIVVDGFEGELFAKSDSPTNAGAINVAVWPFKVNE